MSLTSFTKTDLMTCFKAGDKWMDREIQLGCNLVDLIEPEKLTDSIFNSLKVDEIDEPHECIRYLIGKHILKNKNGHKTWQAYLKTVRKKHQKFCYLSEPEHLYFKRRTRSLIAKTNPSPSPIN
ncbi:LAME_0F06018g1_1 [Lachancea meyersii CBS 8951]|uniref:LAME_0F06018g1_1 n=1 Tax=Lachancea meyersii CBS 8951 TaxID=1266667 RepID=A0A1G4JT62_9SACH|nr:LAME_0F06018g1_1 [Lachancea meyersii CBS 8951]